MNDDEYDDKSWAQLDTRFLPILDLLQGRRLDDSQNDTVNGIQGLRTK